MQETNRNTRISSTDMGEAGWSQLSQELASKLSPTIVALASFDDGTMYRQSTGIVITNSEGGTSILTSSDFLANTNGRLKHSLEITVRLPNRQLLQGVVQHHRLPCRQLLVITTEHSPVLAAACLADTMQVEPLTELFAVRRCYDSSELMGTSGELIESPNGVENEGFVLSTCGITATGTGGPLVDVDGNIVGINDYHDQEGTPYVQGNKIDECLRVVRIRYVI
jgi:hypothetical protein